MSAEVLRRRANFLAEYRWGLAFGIALWATFGARTFRPLHPSFAYDLIPFAALGAVWLGAGVLLGVLGRYWARRASSDVLPIARAER